MFDDLANDRLPRTPRRNLSPSALRRIDDFVTMLDRRGANNLAIQGRANDNDLAPTTKRRLLAV